jgi:hypothetical protein
MNKSKLFIPIFFILILAAACGKASPTSEPTKPPTPIPPTSTRMPPTSTPLPPTDTPLPTVPPEPEIIVIDAFEAAQTDWQAGMEPEYIDSSAVNVTLTTNPVSPSMPGMQALQMNFAKSEKPKAIFFLVGQFDFSQAHMLQFDILCRNAIEGVAFGVLTGPDSTWYESSTVPVNMVKYMTVSFDLTASNYKALSTNWEFRTPIMDLDNVQRLAIIIFPTRKGSAYLDNVLLVGPR